MTEQTKSSLEGLQAIDEQIHSARNRIAEFEPLMEEVESPAVESEKEIETTRSRLQEMTVEERRLELAAKERRARIAKLEDRLNQVRNVREEAAVSAELDLVRRALEGDEQEAYTLLDQIRKLEDRLADQTEAAKEARAAVEPRRQELIQEKAEVEARLDDLTSQRGQIAAGMEPRELQVYESIRGKGSRRAVARLTHDGACGNCYNMVPLQLCNEIRHGAQMIRCEACGVILGPPPEEALEGGSEEE